MTHIWVRAESRENERRVGITPTGVATLLNNGFHVTVEHSTDRIIPDEAYAATGADMADAHSWPKAPRDAIIFGLKELPEDGTPLPHRHIMFGHAFKGQPAGRVLLDRFKAGGGSLYDIEYLVDEDGRRVAAFGYWAGFAGAAVALQCWAAQNQGSIARQAVSYPNSDAMIKAIKADMPTTSSPTALVIGALGRVGTGASDLCEKMGVAVTKWDMAETAHGGPFPEVLDHTLFFNCILAHPGTPVFIEPDAGTKPRALRVIGDIACDPDSDFSPVKVYDRVTSWQEPALRVHENPPLDVTAIDNLPSMLPLESSEDFAGQLLPTLLTLNTLDKGVWGRAAAEFSRHL